MSVPKNKRTENKLQALKETLDMVKYTIQMCENEITKNNISEIMPELKPLKIEPSF